MSFSLFWLFLSFWGSFFFLSFCWRRWGSWSSKLFFRIFLWWGVFSFFDFFVYWNRLLITLRLICTWRKKNLTGTLMRTMRQMIIRSLMILLKICIPLISIFYRRRFHSLWMTSRLILLLLIMSIQFISLLLSMAMVIRT